MSRHESPSPALRTAASTETAQDDHSGTIPEGQILPPLGVLNLQSPVVEECYDWVEKFKSGVIKKSAATFEIYLILVTSGEKSEIVKTTAESYVKILNQHNLKISRAFKRGRMGSREEKAPNSPRLSHDSSCSSARPESRASSIDSGVASRKKKKGQ